MNKGTMAVYGCGGFGVNITKTFEKDAGNDIPGHAIVTPYYVDTSRSNLESDIDDSRIFILQGVDGSGKVRKTNHPAIAENVRLLLKQFQPAEFNIVVFSSSGGSGSVFGPLLISELQKRGVPVVGIVVGSDESVITANNTLNTIKSLENIAIRNGVPTVMYYEHNRPGQKQSDVDARCTGVIGRLSTLVSRENHGLDTKDIRNWADYTQSTDVEPRLARLHVYSTNEDAEAALTQPISLASLYESKDSVATSLTPDYITSGYPRAKMDYLKLSHFAVTMETIPEISREITEKVAEMERNKQARVVHASLVSSVGDEDLIL